MGTESPLRNYPGELPVTQTVSRNHTVTLEMPTTVAQLFHGESASIRKKPKTHIANPEYENVVSQPSRSNGLAVESSLPSAKPDTRAARRKKKRSTALINMTRRYQVGVVGGHRLSSRFVSGRCNIFTRQCADQLQHFVAVLAYGVGVRSDPRSQIE